MVLIIDSGSTKADWVLTDGKKQKLFSTPGMNPYFLSDDELYKIIRKASKNFTPAKIERIYFYGTGTSSPKPRGRITRSFKRAFPKAKISAEHDILGAVLATCGNEEGISCILGTGCNSIYFDGKKIEKNNYGLGFILSDEGAGSWLGKKLITHYMYELLPPSLSKKFGKRYKITKDILFKNVYNNPVANSWLASFVPFLYENKDDIWVRNLVLSGFDEFITLFVMNYPRYKNVPVHFVGSVSFLFSDILKVALRARNIKQGKIIKKPIDGLVEYVNSITNYE